MSEHPSRARRLAVWLVLALILLALTHLDARLHDFSLSSDVEYVKTKDWYEALRQIGYLPVWIGVALILCLVESSRSGTIVGRKSPLVRGGGILLSAITSGAIAELSKLVIRRHRPNLGTDYTFDYGVGAGLAKIGTVSSHAAVAFGAAFFLARVFPQARWIFIAGACGCGWTRLLVGQHYTTDVYAAIVISWFVARWAHRLLLPVPGRMVG